MRVQISTASSFAWTIGAGGCPPDYVANCENSRGYLFNTNESLTWVPNSIYELGIEDNLGGDTSGNTGYDTAVLDWQGSEGPTVEHATVFNIIDSKYWLGEFGLNPRPTNFSNFGDPRPSFLQALRNTSQIPSIAWSYTAGNQYRYQNPYGSLVLGGYDASRFEPTNVTFPFYEDISRDMLVHLTSLTTDNTVPHAQTSELTMVGSLYDLLPDGGISLFIDSTIPSIWLPLTACAAFENAFGLVWDDASSLYLVNNTHHQRLLNMNANVTFTLSPNATGGSSVQIVLPYGAFNLQVQYPLVQNTSYYFPLQRAANESQYTLGRAFLQEAYIIYDYERQNFTVAPCTWPSSGFTPDVKAILSPDYDKKPGSGGLSTGAIVGVAIGIVALIAIFGAIFWFVRRRKRTEKRRIAELEAKEAGSGTLDATHSADGSELKPFISAPIGGEIGGGEIHEMNAPHKAFAAEMDSPYKTDPNKVGYAEMGGGEYFGPGKGYAHEMEADRGPVYEMPGSDVQEMEAHGAHETKQ